MNLFFCGLLLFPFAAVVETSPVRARRENVLSFLNDAFSATTEKAIPTKITGNNSARAPEEEKKSEEFADMSVGKSAEKFHNSRSPVSVPEAPEQTGGESRDLGSRETLRSPSRRTGGVNSDDVQSADTTSTLQQDLRSSDHSGPQGEQQASGEHTDLNSEEEAMMRPQDTGSLSGTHCRDTGGVKRRLAPSQSGERPDEESLEERLAAVGKARDADDDETREYMSSEIHPYARPGPGPIQPSFPAWSRTS
ncbi:uncharacterized protein LOC115397109 isoform X2 [Salarias fasciatus]|uniref:uncharacterized protein LOC115397109 isoform X2 n=1 Tax=Salarias fasciatus TaxID=181472 RepID=UPI001176C05E|nr:uncharacterized protein LOC115397109 isoform X2 [Salarias fasciatus]